jgi:hypothetical protein
MGYYSLDPLGKGFFRVDPAATLPPEALAFYSETTIFRTGASAVGQVSEQVATKIAKEIAEEVAETVSKNVGEAVTAATAEKTAKEVMQQAYQNVQERAIRNNGKQLSGAALTSALKKEAKLLSTESLETAAKKTATDVATTTGRKAGKSIPEGVEKAAFKYTALGTGAVVIYNWGDTLAEGFIDVLGDTAASAFGGNCERSNFEENYPDDSPEQIDARLEECQDKAAKNVMLLGAAGLGIVGLLGFAVISRLIPKRKSSEPAEPSEPLEESE